MNKFIGGILLIIGTSIGAGILALPLVTAAGGFWHSTLLLVLIWFFMTLGAFFILEVTLWLPENTNMISMAKATLGKGGQIVTWLVYLFLLYALLSAFTAGGSDLLSNLLSLVHIEFPHWVDAMLFVVSLGALVADGIRSVDWANRGLLSVKLGFYVLLLLLIMPHIDLSRLPQGEWKALPVALMPVITSFGFAIVMPSLRTYFKSDVKKLRLSILIGSIVPLICYILWNMVVQATLPAEGSVGLIQMAQSTHSVSNLTNALSYRHNGLINSVVHVFTSLCITTSFLGVALSLNDFLADGLKVEKKGRGRWLCLALTFLPPLLMTLFYPGIFIKALSYAGILVVLLLMLLPALMVWKGRYKKQLQSSYTSTGGKLLVGVEIFVSMALIGYGIFQTFFKG